MKRCGALLLVAIVAGSVAAGCSAETPKTIVPREIGDKVTDGDLEAYFEVIDDLPDKKLPEMPPLFKQPPAWDDQRTLPINELMREEADELEKTWNDAVIVRHLSRDRALQKALRERLTLEQFAGLTKTIGVALARNTIRPEQDLNKIIEEGKKRLEVLRNQVQRFNQLQPDERHTVLTTAMWITRIDRAKRLLQVPPENRAMAKAHLERLAAIFPKEFTSNPFDAITDQLEEQGMAFQELRQSGLDTEIDWSESQAIRGNDTADPEFRDTAATGGTTVGAIKAPASPAANDRSN